ncbi:MAG: M23 family metallopeptidase [Salibacteraceae bacterium]
MAKKGDNTEKKKLYKRLKNHYKLVILNIDTFEERFSLLLTPMNVLILSALSLILLITVTFLLLGFTPLRYYLPDYADEVLVRKIAVEAAFKADSMEIALAQRDAFINNFNNVLEGKIYAEDPDSLSQVMVDPQKVKFTRSPEDSMLRVELEKEDLVNLNPKFNKSQDSKFLLFPPLNGTLTDRFNAQKEHFGVDITAPKDATIKAIDDGTVIIAAYTAETGHIIQVQHDNDLISVYKHNSVLLKKQGAKVRAGEAIAIIGETGEFSTGPHLHFELWRNGVPLNPESFFSFQ